MFLIFPISKNTVTIIFKYTLNKTTFRGRSFQGHFQPIQKHIYGIHITYNFNISFISYFIF